jgi:CRP-like cAMP-binding protein
MQAPTYFGEIGILERMPRTASVTAAERCRCLLIDGDELLDAVQSSSASSSMLTRARSLLAVTHPSLPTDRRAQV